MMTPRVPVTSPQRTPAPSGAPLVDTGRFADALATQLAQREAAPTDATSTRARSLDDRRPTERADRGVAEPTAADRPRPERRNGDDRVEDRSRAEDLRAERSRVAERASTRETDRSRADADESGRIDDTAADAAAEAADADRTDDPSSTAKTDGGDHDDAIATDDDTPVEPTGIAPAVRAVVADVAALQIAPTSSTDPTAEISVVPGATDASIEATLGATSAVDVDVAVAAVPTATARAVTSPGHAASNAGAAVAATITADGDTVIEQPTHTAESTTGSTAVATAPDGSLSSEAPTATRTASTTPPPSTPAVTVATGTGPDPATDAAAATTADEILGEIRGTTRNPSVPNGTHDDSPTTTTTGTAPTSTPPAVASALAAAAPSTPATLAPSVPTTATDATSTDIDADVASAPSTTQALGNPGVARSELTAPARLASVIAPEAARLRGTANHRTLEVRLDPPDLGTVDIEIRSNGSTITVVARTESTEAMQAVLRQRDAIEASLRDMGMDLSGFDVSAGTPDRDQAETNRRAGTIPAAATVPDGDADTAPPTYQEGSVFL